ncbi:GNAT family N-acetyltransferase [Salinicola sp. CR57]|uniref:GNAT family N-acetyltransferase n=1 Tax=Salinicola sp. CR57 TaxID=1949086 RepID=UPI0018E5829D|nr:GNAT family N-acetyltransferase [Salinicola sp. CR57]
MTATAGGSVYNNTTDGQYELQFGGMTAVAAYQPKDSVVIFNHTGVPPEFKGQGVGCRLIAGALNDVRQ